MDKVDEKLYGISESFRLISSHSSGSVIELSDGQVEALYFCYFFHSNWTKKIIFFILTFWDSFIPFFIYFYYYLTKISILYLSHCL